MLRPKHGVSCQRYTMSVMITYEVVVANLRLVDVGCST